MKSKSWSREQLAKAVSNSKSVRQVLKQLSLKEAGGNYFQISKYIKEYNIDNSHFTGRAWNKGMTDLKFPRNTLKEILVPGSNFQSYKLKKRLIHEGLKIEKCENCGWAERSKDGRIPLELDHINGNSLDNRLENLRILCPNCHSLEPTHRGRNRRSVRAEMVEW
jgi:hypothetical protein